MSRQDGDGQENAPDGGVRDHGQADDDALSIDSTLSQAAPDEVTSHWIRDAAALVERALERMQERDQAGLDVYQAMAAAQSCIADALRFGGIDD